MTATANKKVLVSNDFYCYTSALVLKQTLWTEILQLNKAKTQIRYTKRLWDRRYIITHVYIDIKYIYIYIKTHIQGNFKSKQDNYFFGINHHTKITLVNHKHKHTTLDRFTASAFLALLQGKSVKVLEKIPLRSLVSATLCL